jgi:hypothetical protein
LTYFRILDEFRRTVVTGRLASDFPRNNCANIPLPVVVYKCSIHFLFADVSHALTLVVVVDVVAETPTVERSLFG